MEASASSFTFHKGLLHIGRPLTCTKRGQSLGGCPIWGSISHLVDAERRCGPLATLALVEDDGAGDGGDYAEQGHEQDDEEFGCADIPRVRSASG